MICYVRKKKKEEKKASCVMNYHEKYTMKVVINNRSNEIIQKYNYESQKFFNITQITI